MKKHCLLFPASGKDGDFSPGYLDLLGTFAGALTSVCMHELKGKVVEKIPDLSPESVTFVRHVFNNV